MATKHILRRQECEPGREWGTVVGAARLGEGASIGNGHWMFAHGGAVPPRWSHQTCKSRK